MYRLIATPLLLLSSLALGAQSPLLGSWRADVPLPNGIIQTFRFTADGKFDLAMALAVDGRYTIGGTQMIETITLPDGTSHADTSEVRVTADSLVITDHAAGAKSLRRAGAPGKTIVGEWTITLASGPSATYEFAPDGSMHVRATVKEEQGTYTVTGDALRLSNDGLFQLPATTKFSIADKTLTLTPAQGAVRTFHKIG